MIRLGAGAVAYVSEKAKVRPGPPALFTVDVFATLLARTADDNAAWRAGAKRVAQAAAAAGLRPPDHPLAFRRRVEGVLARRALARGEDPEFPHHLALREMLERLGVEDAGPLADQIADWELRREMSLTAPIDAMSEHLRQRLQAGFRVVAVSDTRYTANELRELFAYHGLPTLSAIYSSADEGASKFSGRLFEIVARREGVDLGRLRHVGDSWLADILAPAQKGVDVRRVARPPIPPAARPLPPAPPRPGEEAADPAFRVGYETLGPILTAFCRILLEQAGDDGVNHLAFVARDGDLLHQITRTLVAPLPVEDVPRLSYVHFSRRALASAATPSQASREAEDRIFRYVEQSGVLGDRTALVDVGWKGTIRDTLAGVITRRGARPPRAYYVGFWNEESLPGADAMVSGVICDQRRGRGPREGGAWHAAFLIEGVARAAHGTVIGYRDAPDGGVEPIHAERGDAREAEIRASIVQERVRAGILAYAAWWATVGAFAPPVIERVRRAAQERLFSLAFFPTPDERHVGRQLVHTETGLDSATPLIQSHGSTVKDWVRGVRSPWKGGYLQEAGGAPLAALYLLFETLVSVSPPGAKAWVRRRLSAAPPRERGPIPASTPSTSAISSIGKRDLPEPQ